MTARPSPAAALDPALAAADVPAARRRHRSAARMAWNRFRRHRMALAGLAVVAAFALASAAPRLASPYDPQSSDLDHRLAAPTWAHPMGTDDLGRDLLTRILYGGRISLTIGVAAMALAVTLGTAVGAAAGFYGRWVDNALMRLTDLVLSFPQLFVLIVLALVLRNVSLPALRTGAASVLPIVLVIAVTSWMPVARLVRATFLSLREATFVEAARGLGVRNGRIIARHVLPNSLGPIIVAATLRVASSIITESGLSFLGFGVQPPTPTWGNMLNAAQDQMTSAPWTAIYPGLMIFLTVIAINYIGDGLRDALDPHHAR
ncbi:MAG TPA: ABC transporter permease [bacterium]|nr:ABC transporter permease [bacterium]